jgi:hypothetical protein
MSAIDPEGAKWLQRLHCTFEVPIALYGQGEAAVTMRRRVPSHMEVLCD